MKKMIVFDMDGTIASLYTVDNWLEMLLAEDTTPYTIAEPMYNMIELVNILRQLQSIGYLIAVTTWGSKNASSEYNKAVAAAKKEWLNKYDFPFDEFHCVKYGTTKANCTRTKAEYQILIDDNEKVRKGWNLGSTINAQNNIIPELLALLN